MTGTLPDGCAGVRCSSLASQKVTRQTPPQSKAQHPGSLVLARLLKGSKLRNEGLAVGGFRGFGDFGGTLFRAFRSNHEVESPGHDRRESPHGALLCLHLSSRSLSVPLAGSFMVSWGSSLEVLNAL